ncbi:MAG: hypothetical protein K2X03_15170 [Bryobacteraceae bacterium]|nr:hypothetical protein [Bryobacteraceae bacterium]
MLAGIGWLVAVYFCLQPGALLPTKTVWILIILIGLTARIAAWQQPPFLTDDPYRYRFEGRLQAQGGNPYLVRPLDADPDSRIPGSDVRAIYGPLLLLLERATYPLASEDLRLWRLPAALADLLTALFLALWLRHPRWLIYWLCPLPIIEFWSSGHHDAVLLALLALGLWRPLGGAPWALAVYTKYWPLLLLPFLRQWRALVATAAGALLFLPYLGDLAQLIQNARYLSGFVGGWRNNDSLYGLLLALTGDQYRAKYLSFALIAAAGLAIWRTRWTLSTQCLAMVVTLLALSANVHPWYLTWMLPFLTRTPWLPAMAGIVLAPILYAPLFDWHLWQHWDGVRDTRWLVYAGVLTAGLASKVLSLKEK